MNKSYMVIVTVTNPIHPTGGIGIALPGYLRAMQLANIPYRSIPTYSPHSLSGKWWWALKAIPTIVQQIISSNRSQQKIIVYSHPGAGISLLREGLILAIAKLFGARTVIQLHTPKIITYLNNPFQRRMLALLFTNIDELAVLSPWWESYLLRFNYTHTTVLPNPLPHECERQARTQAVNARQANDGLKLLSLSRTEKGKGFNLVIDAMSYLPKNTHLTIAGTGSELASLRRQVIDLGLEKQVSFSGWVAGRDKQLLFDDADIFCLPSSMDSFGMSFIEAMSNGLPVVALDWRPIKDVVPHQCAGLLIQESCPEALANAILMLEDEKLRKSYGENGKRWVLEKFLADSIGKKLKNIFDRLAV